MARTRKEAHCAHSGKCRGQAECDAQHYIPDRTRIFAALDEADSLHAERRECREAAAESDDQQRAQIIVRLDIHELADEDPYEEAARDVHEKGTEWKPMWSEVLHSAAK